jgi:hypothetical protein
MKNKENFWMAISGGTGFAFFLIANFTNLFTGASVIAGIIQLIINTFVFVVWTKAFIKNHGFKKFVAFFGVIVPCLLAITTLYRVLIPYIFITTT